MTREKFTFKVQGKDFRKYSYANSYLHQKYIQELDDINVMIPVLSITIMLINTSNVKNYKQSVIILEVLMRDLF